MRKDPRPVRNTQAGFAYRALACSTRRCTASSLQSSVSILGDGL